MSTSQTSGGPQPISQKHYEIARDLHDHIESQANLAVTKSTLLLAAHAILCTAYVQIAGSLKVYERNIDSFSEKLFLFSGILLLVAFLVSLMSIWPKRKSTEGNRLVFFAGIAEISSAGKYEEEFNTTSENKLGSMLIADIHGKSVWLSRTFMLVRVAILCSAFGTILCVIAVWFLKTHSEHAWTTAKAVYATALFLPLYH